MYEVSKDVMGSVPSMRFPADVSIMPSINLRDDLTD